MNATELIDAVRVFSEAAVGVPEAELEREDWEWRSYDGLRFAYLLTYQQLLTFAVQTAVARQEQGRPLTEAQRILAQYTTAYRDLHGALVGVSNEDIEKPPAEGEWPLRQVLWHMMHVQSAFVALCDYAVERVRAGGDLPIEMGRDEIEARRGEVKDEGDLDDILGRYDRLHDRVTMSFAGLADNELAAPSLWWEGWDVEVRFRLHRLDAHIREHLIQVDKTLVGIGRPPTEPQRLLRQVYNALGEAEGAALGATDVLASERTSLAEEIRARAEDVRAYARPAAG